MALRDGYTSMERHKTS